GTFLSTCSVIYPENMHVWRERRSSHFLAWRVNHTWMTVPITAVGLVCVCVCRCGSSQFVCVREREREKKKTETESVCRRVCVFVCGWVAVCDVTESHRR